MIELDKLYRIALENAALTRDYKKRFIYEKLKKLTNSKGRGAFLISGLRGIGKTTVMLQIFDELKNAFYFSADSSLIRTESIYTTTEQAYRNGYKFIFIDEIHKYPKWVSELKNIYDDFNVKVIASGSSTAAIRKGSIELGRRAMDIEMSPLTFKEFFYLNEGEKYTADMSEVLDKRSAIKWLAEHPRVERYYKNYLDYGGFPIAKTDEKTIFKLIRRMIYEDALAEFSLTRNKVDVAEKLLGFLSVSKLGEFSYTSFSSTSGYAKSTIYDVVNMLKELDILTGIEQESAKSKANEIIKLMFFHPNLRNAVAEQLMKKAEIGSLREEYFVFHMREIGIPVFIPKKMKKNPDYLVKINNKKMLFEIGGRSKTNKQLSGKDGTVLGDEALIVLGFVQKTDRK